MLTLNNSTFGEDSEGNEVFMCAGDFISEISDTGPVIDEYSLKPAGWNVSCRFTPSHKQWTEIVTVDAVKLLKALDALG